MTNKEIAKMSGVSVATVARMKKKPGWPGDDDKEKLIAYIQSTKGRAGRPMKGQEKVLSQSDSDEVTRLAIEYKRSQIEKNNTTTRDYQLRILREYRGKMIKGCSEAMAIIFKAIKSLDLDVDQVRVVKVAIDDAREHLKGIASE